MYSFTFVLTNSLEYDQQALALQLAEKTVLSYFRSLTVTLLYKCGLLLNESQYYCCYKNGKLIIALQV